MWRDRLAMKLLTGTFEPVACSDTAVQLCHVVLVYCPELMHGYALPIVCVAGAATPCHQRALHIPYLELLLVLTGLNNITEHHSNKAMRCKPQRAVCMRLSHSSITCLLANEQSSP